ncbi:MAG TPA: phospholipase [Porphyromonadaceae bacterium]|nr:phospholipase [Porphyromonadaceae bacterium]
MRKAIILILSAFIISNLISAQEIITKDQTELAPPPKLKDILIPFSDTTAYYNPDSVRREMDKRPYFTLFKDNYFLVGAPLGTKPTKENSNVKFQISISQRLTKSILPFNTYLYLTYTQKVIWNVFEKSMPMKDMNFNPGIGLGRMIIHKDKVIGFSYFQLEHESNGRDGDASRSWNKISMYAGLQLNRYWDVQAKFWLPIVDGGLNKDILDYSGIFQISANYNWSDRFTAGMVFVKRRGFNFNGNIQLGLSYKLFKNQNQYLYLQYYNGYGEYLLDYNKYQSMLRIGLIIRPQFFSIY